MQRRHSLWLAVISLAFVASGCAQGTAGAPPRRNDSQRISRAEIQQSGALNAYDAVQRLRPRWLQASAVGSINQAQMQSILVYVDNSRLGGPETLRTINANGIEFLEYLDAVAAATRLPNIGTTKVAGAILITTLR